MAKITISKKPAAPKKTTATYRFSDNTKELLKQLCETHNRSATNMIEFLIAEQAKRDKVKK